MSNPPPIPAASGVNVQLVQVPGQDGAGNGTALDPPAFVIDESKGPAQIAQDARGTVRFSIKAKPVAFPIGGGSDATTLFTVSLVPGADGQPVDRDGDGLPDVWPKIFLVQLDPNDPTGLTYDTSTGGLIAVLWADRHPGAVRALVLNSPWLELQGSSVARHVSAPAIAQLARFQPKTAMPNIDPGYYARTLRKADGGEWEYNDRWRPSPAFPVRAGWLRAVIAGHARVARGLDIGAPILVLASASTLISPRWNEDMRSSDVVLDVELIARRAVQLGPVVTVVRIAGGMHDLTLSPRPARKRFYTEISRWSVAYA